MSYVILVLGNVGVGKTSLINCVVQTSTTTDDDDVVEQQQEAATITTAVTNNNNHHTTPTKQAPCHEGMDPLSPMSPQSPVSPIMPQRRGIDAHHAVLPGKDGEEDQRYTLIHALDEEPVPRRYFHHNFVLTFDLTDRLSFEDILIHYRNILHNSNLKQQHIFHYNIILVGTKSDVFEQRKVSFAEALTFSKELHIPYCEVSSTTCPHKVKEMFTFFFEQCSVSERKLKRAVQRQQRDKTHSNKENQGNHNIPPTPSTASNVTSFFSNLADNLRKSTPSSLDEVKAMIPNAIESVRTNITALPTKDDLKSHLHTKWSNIKEVSKETVFTACESLQDVVKKHVPSEYLSVIPLYAEQSMEAAEPHCQHCDASPMLSYAYVCTACSPNVYICEDCMQFLEKQGNVDETLSQYHCISTHNCLARVCMCY